MDGEKSVLDVEVGERIRARRKARGLSQEVLAGRLGVSQTKISDTENGTVVVQFTPAQWIQLCDELGLAHPNELLGQESQAGRVSDIVALASDLDDSDIDALRNMARQLASARQAARRVDLPEEVREMAEVLPESERRALLRGIELRDKAARIVAERGDDGRGGQAQRRGRAGARGDRVGEGR